MKILLILSLFSLSACGIVGKNENKLPLVKIHGTVHKPYCGGAKPSPDVAAGYYESMKNGAFKLYKGEAGSTLTEASEFVQDVKMDVEGNVSLNLEPGSYLLIRADKFLSVEEFIAANGPVEAKLYEVQDRACFESWMKRVDLYFTVEADTLIEFREKAKCWVGTNPCIRYVGPPAP